MKKTTLFSLLTMLFLLIGSNIRADELFYTLWTVSAEGTNHTNYTQYFDDEHDGMIWNAPGNQRVSNDMTDRWRIGGKSLDKVDRTITAKTPMGSAIDRVVLNHFGVSRDQVTVNSLTLTVASDEEYKTILDEVTLTPAIKKSTEGSVEFIPTATIGTEWEKGAYYKLTINLSNTSTSNGGLDLASIEFYAPTGSVVVARPVITPDGGTFTEPQEVTITADEGCTIIYTLDGTDPSMAAGRRYTGPFTVSTNCTVKAIALDVTGASSSIASATFTFPTTFSSIAELCAAATTTEEPALVEFNGWICTGVKSSNAYFTDGRCGIQLYQSGHGFEVGDMLKGSAQIKLVLYNECAEIKGLTATTEGVIVEKGIEAKPITVAISDLRKEMQGCLITVEDVTYNATDKVFIDGDDNRITPFGSFITLPELLDGETYNATGVAIWFVKNGSGYWEIAPRTEEELQLTSGTYVAKPVITPNGGTFTEPQEVTITAGDNCTIIYTTDGTDPSMAAGRQYTAPFTVSENCVVKAIALDVTGASSTIASAEFKFISTTAIPTIGRLCAIAPAQGETEVLVEFNNWIVTGVKGGQVFFTDGRNGIVNYIKDHGFEVGDVLNGTAVVTLTTFNECAEITSLTATTSGVTVTKGEGAAPMNIAIADLEKDMQGCLLHFDGLTYSSDEGAFFDDDDNKIVPNNKFTSLPELRDSKTYNATGVAIWFVSSEASGYWVIAPRTKEEFQLVTSQIAPESAWSVGDELIVDINDPVNASFRTTSDGIVTYTSSNEEVATIDKEGNIYLVGKGVTTITATVAETDTYLPDSKSFTLTVMKSGYADATFAYNDEDITGHGASDIGGEIRAVRNDVLTLYANRAYAKPGDSHIKFYGSNGTNGPSTIQLTVADGYAITQILFKATSASYIKDWQDQFGTSIEKANDNAVWRGMQNKVVLTNMSSSQARFNWITVTYVKLQDLAQTITIGENGMTTFCCNAPVVVSGAEQFAIAGAITGAGGTEGVILEVDTLTSVVPANVGVLLMGKPGEYKVYTHPDLADIAPIENFLIGVLADTEAPVGSYVMQEQSGITGFYKVAEGSAVNVPAGTAYLELKNDAPAFFFTEMDYETGISKVEKGKQTAEGSIYNLAGQRLSKMQKGINIIGGKKVLK